MNEYGLKRIPDYTELAYKEAVSKLRYFLSGNYSPSVRSYGGSPSIKNLDESEPELDKKYSNTSPYSSNLLDSKPRPRLTAKYATLYADSLKNYNPGSNLSHLGNVTGIQAPPPPADLSGGTNPDVVNFIQKQEEYIEQLERESQYCRDELNNLLGKVKEVISENENLHEAQKNKLITRMFHSYNTGSETDDLDDVGDSPGLDSDNKMTSSKSRKSGKIRSTRLEGPNIVFESRISELEAQLAQSKIDLKKIQEENNENKRKLASGLVDNTCLDGFKRQIDNLQRDKSALESQISKLKLNMEARDADLDGRYKRGSDAVEQQLRDERNNLETEVRRLKDDLAKERSKIRELVGEGSRRAIQERSAAEQRYNAHFDELSHDLAAQYDNVSKLQLELERQRREENDLKREISMKNAAIDELKMDLKNKTSSLQADLVQAQAEKASVEEELASARLAIERQQRQAKHEANRLNSEIQSLRQRLDRADADLVHSRRENLRLSEQISTLEKEINMKNLTPNSPEKNKKEKEITSMMQSIENKHAKTVAELESMIQSQNSLMEKLTGECRLLTDKLDDANRRHKTELGTLQRQVDSLGRSLQPVSPANVYKAPATHAASPHRDIEYSTSNAGPNYSGVDTTGHPQVSRKPSLTDNTKDRVHSDAKPRTISRQASRNSIKAENVPQPNIVEDEVADNEEIFEKHERSDEMPEKLYREPVVDAAKTVMEAEPTQQLNQEYELNQSPAAYEQPAYEQNYQQDYEPETAEYPQGFDQQNFPQQGYTEGQYPENYEQYPEQQYTDPNPNVAYEGQQYDNYATDEAYQNVQDYPNQQYNSAAANQEYPVEGQEYTEAPGSEQFTAPQKYDTQEYQEGQKEEYVESKRSNSPKENVIKS